MKKKIYLIIYAVMQVVISIYSIINVNSIAKTQVKLVGDLFKDMPKDMQSMMAEAYSLEAMKASVMLTAIVCLIIGLILLWLFVRDRVSIKKGLTIGLIITSIVLGLSDIILILSIIALILVIKTEKKKVVKDKKERQEIKKLHSLKVTAKDLVWIIVLLLAYATQFFIPSLLNNKTILLIYDILFNVLVFALVIYIFGKRLKRDFKAFKENSGSYIGYIFKWWGIMLGLSFVAAFVRLLLGGAIETANQEALNSAPLWYVGPLAIIWAPVVEEGIFRGGLRRFIKNDKLFIVLSALLFGLLHTIGTETGIYNIFIQSLQYMVMGGVMAYTYAKTNNIFVNMGIHCIQNTLGVILMMLMPLL